ncbi:HEPN domain-containing protein [Paenibacillus paeoniae]|uniref:Uncharacterized protein n=1 Tax=Paenibacillus paeoniae TaxID=2292705 RepID=A0A371P0J9_9BACL|nr:HEPN domain-containing protein [Paenibacillus paeoniae]REK69425.1 hypothetical protein DX130_25070 [Paenibacillus paeoniae]
MTSLVPFVLSYLFSCKSKTALELESMNHYGGFKPLSNLIDKISGLEAFEPIYEFELTELFLTSYVLEPAIKNQQTYSNADAIILLNQLDSHLRANINDYWIFAPLNRAYLTSTVKFGDFIFISGSEEEKLTTISRLGGTSKKETRLRLNHLLRSRSNGFLDHPIVGIKVRHQYGYVTFHAQKILYLVNSILQSIFWARIYPSYTYPVRANRYYETKSEHLMVYSERNFCNIAIGFNQDCKLNLDWLFINSSKKQFNDLFQTFVLTKYDELTYRFYKGVKFLKKAIESEEQRDIFSGYGLSLLQLTVAGEAILLSHIDQKRAGLAFLIPRLVKINNISPNQCSLLVDEIYTWRSEYVHGGIETYPNFNQDFSPGDTVQKYIDFKRAVAGLICCAPRLIRLMKSRTNSRSGPILEKWFMYLKNHWVIGRKYNPTLANSLKRARSR